MAIIRIGENIATIGTKVIESLQPFTPPLDDMIVWYDSVSVIKDGSDYIEQLTDKSGNGYHCVQAVQEDKPLWVDDQQNGYPHIRFSGSQFLQKAFGTSYSQPITMFVVWRKVSGGDAIVTDGYSANWWVYNSGTVIYIGTNVRADYTIGVTSFGMLLHTAEFNGATSNAWEDGVQKITNGNMGTSTLDGITIGSQKNGNNGINGDVCEVILYEGVLSSVLRQAIDNYLIVKYAL